MGKLNRKLPKTKAPPVKDGAQKVKGPFPIYRSTPVQLNGPEPKSFKIVERQAMAKAGPSHSSRPKPDSASKAAAGDSEAVDAVKVKKLRKLAIQRMTKKGKKQFRKDEVLKKIELTQQAFKDDRATKKREKTAITGDMKPLFDALPSLDSLFQMKMSQTIKSGLPPQGGSKAEAKTKAKQKVQEHLQKRKDFLSRCQKVNAVMKSSKFKKNPKKMIAEHIQKTRREQLQLLLGSS